MLKSKMLTATYLLLAAYKAGECLYHEKEGMVSAKQEVEHIIRDLKEFKLKSKKLVAAA